MIPVLIIGALLLFLVENQSSASATSNAAAQAQAQAQAQEQAQSQYGGQVPSVSGVSSQLASIGTSSFGAGISSAFGTGGSLAGGLGAAATTGGIAAAAIGASILLSNVFSCGTITQVGCEKRHDTAIQIMAEIIARKLAYAVETGVMSKATALATLAQTYQQDLAARQEPSTHGIATWYVGATPVAGYPDPLPQLADVPSTSKSGSYFVGQNATDTQFFTQVMPAFINSL